MSIRYKINKFKEFFKFKKKLLKIIRQLEWENEWLLKVPPLRNRNYPICATCAWNNYGFHEDNTCRAQGYELTKEVYDSDACKKVYQPSKILSPFPEEQKKKYDAIRRIGLALNACNNCITTDIPGTKEDDTHWRIDHSQEIKDLDYIIEELDICVPGYILKTYEKEKK